MSSSVATGVEVETTAPSSISEKPVTPLNGARRIMWPRSVRAASSRASARSIAALALS